jgi:DNA invertase Pin-like site-specific DNA recombinase
MARRIGYALVASDDLDLAQQVDELGKAGCLEIYADREAMNTTGTRAKWITCLEGLNEGDVLVVPRIDCLARTLSELSKVLTTLAERRVDLRICQWDPAPVVEPGDFAAIVSRLVEFESANRRKYIRSGVEVARAQGRVGGRRHRLNPYQVKELKALMAQPGADPVVIGKRFGVGRAAVYRYLRRDNP